MCFPEEPNFQLKCPVASIQEIVHSSHICPLCLNVIYASLYLNGTNVTFILHLHHVYHYSKSIITLLTLRANTIFVSQICTNMSNVIFKSYLHIIYLFPNLVKTFYLSEELSLSDLVFRPVFIITISFKKYTLYKSCTQFLYN